MSAGWNISLFHYRNHGADYGRVLVGMQVRRPTRRDFRGFSTDSATLRRRVSQPAYRMFLGR
jgi:threonine dehydratase